MKRPDGYREPTDAEMQCLPEGALRLFANGIWRPSAFVGDSASGFAKKRYAVPITEQEEENSEIARAIEAIKKAKANGWKVTVDISDTWLEIIAWPKGE